MIGLHGLNKQPKPSQGHFQIGPNYLFSTLSAVKIWPQQKDSSPDLSKRKALNQHQQYYFDLYYEYPFEHDLLGS